MKLSDKLKIDHECGDFGKSLKGYSEEAEKLEKKIAALQVELFNYRYDTAIKQGASHQQAKEHVRKLEHS